jgi:hypothetical protein
MTGGTRTSLSCFEVRPSLLGVIVRLDLEPPPGHRVFSKQNVSVLPSHVDGSGRVVGFFPRLEKPMARLPDPQLARQWRQRLDRFEHSDLTVAEFYELEGDSTASLYQWRRKLRDGKSPGDAPWESNGSRAQRYPSEIKTQHQQRR